MPRIQFQQDTALPFGGEAQFFKAGAWYTIGKAHFDLIKRNKLAFIEEKAELEEVELEEVELEEVELEEVEEAAEPIQQLESEYDGDMIAALELLIAESEPSDFAATTGMPMHRAVERVLGRKVFKDEVKRHWKYVLDH